MFRETWAIGFTFKWSVISVICKVHMCQSQKSLDSKIRIFTTKCFVSSKYYLRYDMYLLLMDVKSAHQRCALC